METNKVNAYVSQYKDKVPADNLVALKNALERADDKCESSLSMLKLKDPIFVLMMSIFFGGLGVDRFMIGDIGLGVCKLLFGWVTLGIWPIVDIFKCYKRAKQLNLQSILTALN